MQDEFDLFRAETKSIQPNKQDTFVSPRPKRDQKKKKLKKLRAKKDTMFYFSYEYETLLNCLL